MSWWTADPTLTPLRVFDANSHDGVNLTSKTGDGQLMNFSGYVISSGGNSAADYKKCIIPRATAAADPAIAYSTPLATPPSGCYLALVRVSQVDPTRPTVPNHAPTSITGVTFNYDGAGVGNVAFAGVGHTTAPGGTVKNPLWCVVGVSWTPSLAKVFVNNALLGAGTASVSSNISGNWAGVAGASGPGQGLHCELAAHGFWSGTPTVEGLTDIATAMSLELATPAPTIPPQTADRFLRQENPAPIVVRTSSKGFTIKIDRTGAGVITGNVTEGTPLSSAPVVRKVRLFHKNSAVLMAETWSNSTGDYGFYNVDPTVEYFVVAHDHTRTYNAVVQDMIQP
jgi:hypothetical protein